MSLAVAPAGIAPGRRVIACCGGGIAAPDLAARDASLDERGRAPAPPATTRPG